MLYTRKGDDGTTRTLASRAGRISKSSCQTESLGALDEMNSFLGLVKIKSANAIWSVNGRSIADVILSVQNNLFTIQAEVAGADKMVGDDKVKELEKMVDWMEKEMPAIKTFLISGGMELSALFDIARTLARKTERRVVGAVEKGEFKVSESTLAFLNRLSSLLYALARLSAHKSGINEESPSYR